MPPRASLEGRFRVDIGDEKGQFARYRRWHLRRMAGTALGSLHGVGSESEFDPVAACFERQLCVMQLKRSNGRSWPKVTVPTKDNHCIRGTGKRAFQLLIRYTGTSLINVGKRLMTFTKPATQGIAPVNPIRLESSRWETDWRVHRSVGRGSLRVSAARRACDCRHAAAPPSPEMPKSASGHARREFARTNHLTRFSWRPCAGNRIGDPARSFESDD